MKIKELRLERGLTKVQLAKELGVSTGTIIQWEKDMISNSLGNAVSITDFFEIQKS